MLRPREMCSTTKIEARISRGRSATIRLIASTPPAEAPMTTMSCLAMTPRVLRRGFAIFMTAYASHRISATPSSGAGLETKEIAGLDEDLTSGRDGRASGGRQRSVDRGGTPAQVVVGVGIPDVKGGAGVHEVGEEHVARQVLPPIERDERRVRKHAVVVDNAAKRQGARELVVHLRPDDVVVEDRRGRLRQPAVDVGL